MKISELKYIFYDNDPISYDLIQVTSDEFKQFYIMGYGDFTRWCKARLENNIPTPTYSNFK